MKGGLSWDKLFARTKTVLTIHNIGYQGVFARAVLPDLDLEDLKDFLYQEDLTAGYVSFLKTGILYADMLTTVSKTYAKEIQTPELGMGLEGLLAARADHLVGIVNGVDYREWDPTADRFLPHRFRADDLAGKALDKAALFAELELSPGWRVPLLGIVSRLVAQKGLELLLDVLPVVLRERDVRVVVLGSGEDKYERYFRWLVTSFPGRVAFHAGFSEELAHKIEAASDIFLMPSRYEPCGLNQMYSLRYGTIPLVRKTGGLADTVEPFDPTGRRGSPDGTGFLFVDFNPEALYRQLLRALDQYQDEDSWRRVVRNAMSRDFSWDRQGKEYVDLYRRLVG
jgi:starch synthase